MRRYLGALALGAVCLIGGYARADIPCESDVATQLGTQGQSPTHLVVGTRLNYQGIPYIIAAGDSVPKICSSIERRVNASAEAKLEALAIDNTRLTAELKAYQDNFFIRHWVAHVLWDGVGLFLLASSLIFAIWANIGRARGWR